MDAIFLNNNSYIHISCENIKMKMPPNVSYRATQLDPSGSPSGGEWANNCIISSLSEAVDNPVPCRNNWNLWWAEKNIFSKIYVHIPLFSLEWKWRSNIL